PPHPETRVEVQVMNLAELEQDLQRALAPAASCPAAVALIEEMRELRQRGEPADVWSVLARHPEVTATKQLLTDLACEEFSLRRAEGEALDCGEFAARFPEVGTSLHEILITREFFDDNPDALTASDERLPWPKPGDWLKGFGGLVEELGRGSFARVFLAQQ